MIDKFTIDIVYNCVFVCVCECVIFDSLSPVMAKNRFESVLACHISSSHDNKRNVAVVLLRYRSYVVDGYVYYAIKLLIHR